MDYSETEELVEIELNNEGVTYAVVINLATANILLNVTYRKIININIDHDEAAKFIHSIHGESNIGPNQTNNDIEPEPSTSSSGSTVWSNKRPNTRDHEATKKFLELRDKYSEKFNDKKTLKNQIWKKIADEMAKCGYNVSGTHSEVVEKLRQKFANLQKQYLNYIKHVNTTGEKKRDPPPFFDEIHGIIGLKDKSNPQNLQDSLTENEKETDNDTDNCEFEDNSEAHDMTKKSKIKNRFSVSRNTKPQSTNSQLLDLIQKFHEEEQEDKKRHFKVLENLLEIQNRQRDRLLEQLENFFETKKRERQASTSDSD